MDSRKDLIRKEDFPDAPDPIAKGLVDHQRLELDPSDTTGIQELLRSSQGYIVGRLGNELLRFNTDAHLLTIAPTGGGKGTGLIIPNLLDHPGSAFVIDIRGETVAKTANGRRLQGHKVVVIDPFNITNGKWGISDAYNPFDRIVQDLDSRSSDDRIQRLTQALMFDPSGRMSNEPIWDNATKKLLSGLITLCVRYWPPYRHNLVEILDVLNYSPSEMERFIIELESIIQNDPRAQDDRQLKGLLKILTESKATTKITDNALVQAQTLLMWVGNKSFEGIIEDSTFTFDELQDGKMTVYLVVPEEFIDNCAIWVRLMLESAVFSLKDVSSSKGISTSQLGQYERVLFLLDELPAFGQLDIISSGMATLRGRGVNLWLFIQNLAQLDSTYGKEKARTIIGNAAALQVFGSNELEELEYFSRLIGEEFFDVQSVTISETVTEGSSVSHGTSKTDSHSRTISNSQSISKTAGTSDTFTEGSTINWSKSFSTTKSTGKSRNKGGSVNAGRNFGDGTSESSSTGWNKGGGETRKDGFLGSSHLSRNTSHGTSGGRTTGHSHNSGTSFGTGSSWGEGTSESEGETRGKTYGKSKTTSKSKTESSSITEGTTHTEGLQEGQSNTSSETHSTSESLARGRSITVKQERMKIETVRSLREKLSGRNQLLQVRGHHPFFAPRMSYFVKFLDVDRYMFPDMASLADIEVLDKISARNELTNPFTNHLSHLANEVAWMEELNKKIVSLDESSDPVSLIQSYKELFMGKIPEQVIEKVKEIEKHIMKQKEGFDEVAVVALGMISAMKKVEAADFFLDADDELVANMQYLEELAAQVSGLNPETAGAYKNLPLMGVEKGRDGQYYLTGDDQTWLAQTYANAVKKFAEQIEHHIGLLREKVDEYEAVRNWFVNTLYFIRTNMDNALELAYEREGEWRREFFMKRNGLLDSETIEGHP